MIEHIAEATSTNDVARSRAAEAPHGWAVRADAQTEGRGQRGHGWTSPAGGLYLSVVLKPSVPQRVMGGLPLVCGIGAARAMVRLGVPGVKLKWPNDLVAGDAKLAGLLVEAGWAAGGVYAVCGIGVNMDAPKVEDPERAALPPCGIRALLEGEGAPVPSLDALADAVRADVVAAVDEWSAQVALAGAAATPLGRMADELYDRMAYMGEYVALIDREGRPYGAGTLSGIDVWGRALVRMDDGRAAEEAFDPAQVSVRPLR